MVIHMSQRIMKNRKFFLLIGVPSAVAIVLGIMMLANTEQTTAQNPPFSPDGSHPFSLQTEIQHPGIPVPIVDVNRGGSVDIPLKIIGRGGIADKATLLLTMQIHVDSKLEKLDDFNYSPVGPTDPESVAHLQPLIVPTFSVDKVEITKDTVIPVTLNLRVLPNIEPGIYAVSIKGAFNCTINNLVDQCTGGTEVYLDVQ